MQGGPDAAAPAVAVDASTVVLLRDGVGGPEVLLLERNRAAGFVPGAHVFPGGSVDPLDAAATPWVDGLDDSAASRLTGVAVGGLAFWVTAVRECLEEAGVAPGVAAGDGSDLSRWRRRVHEGAVGLDRVLEAEGARIDAGTIRCFARWVTPVQAPRRFDTRFFVTALADDTPVSHDGSEIVGHTWTAPARALERAAAGEITMILPTVRTLVALSRFGDASAAVSGLDFGDPGRPLLPEADPAGDPRLISLPTDPEGTGGVYDGETGMAVP